MNESPDNLTQGFASNEIAAIDLGSNSFHMIIARITNGSVQILSRLKQRVKLAAGLDENNQLSQEAIDRGVACLGLFAERLKGFPIENVKVVGTYTLRRATNNQQFLEQAKGVFPYPIHIIEGQEEAQYIYSGVSHTQPATDRKLVIDIGGGSTEMIVGESFEALAAESRNLGCLSFATQFFADGKITSERFTQAYDSAITYIQDLGARYQELGWDSVLGSSGTVKTVSMIMATNYDKDGVISADNLQRLIQKALQFSSCEKLKIDGLDTARSDVLLSGLAILKAVFDTYRINEMRYSDGALREGVIYSLLDDSFKVSDIRQHTIDGLSAQFSVDRAQAQRVIGTTKLLSQQYVDWEHPHKSTEMCEILEAAAALCEVGIVINHYGVERHSAYILTHNSMYGFDSEQQKLLATLVRFHKKPFMLKEIFERTRYSKNDVLVLIMMLRLAFIVNRSRQVTEKTNDIQLQISNLAKNYHVVFAETYLKRNPLTVSNLSEEIEALKQCDITLKVN